MNVREGEERDAEAVVEVWTDAYADVDPEGRREAYSLQEYYAVASVADLRVVEDGAGAVVGVVAVFPPGALGRSIAGAGEAELARLAVAAEARGRGIGRALAEGAVEGARGLGAERVALWSRPYQTDAHRLYESLGFRRVPDRDQDDRDGRRWVFVLDL